MSFAHLGMAYGIYIILEEKITILQLNENTKIDLSFLSLEQKFITLVMTKWEFNFLIRFLSVLKKKPVCLLYKWYF